MRIAIDISQSVYDTGVSRYTKELVRHLLRIDRDNEYLLFAGVWRQRKKIEEFLESLRKEKLEFESKVIFLPPRLADLVFNQLRISVDHLIGKCDIFHASNWTTPKTQAKLVTTVHDLTPILFPDSFPKNIIANFKNNLRLIEKNADLILTDCETTRKDLLARIRVRQDKVKTVYLASADHFNPVRDKQKIEKVKSKYKIFDDYILSVSTQEPRKNIKSLIKAFLNLKDNKHQLVLAGKYGWGEEVQFLTEKKDLPVVAAGFVIDEDLPALYSGAKAFVYPSLYEGFGLPVLEAMQSGCPVITSNCSSLAEIAGNGALLIDPKNEESIEKGLKRVLEDSNLRRELSEKGLVQAGKFSWEKTARKTLTAYRKAFE